MLSSLVALVIGFTFAAYYLKRATLGVIAAIFWAVLTYYLYSVATIKWFSDIYYLIAWFTGGTSIVIFLEVIYFKFGTSSNKDNMQPENHKEEKSYDGKTHHEKVTEELRRRKQAKEERESLKDI